jgi:hypothetical protein
MKDAHKAPSLPDPAPPPWTGSGTPLPPFYRPLIDQTREKERHMQEVAQAYQGAAAVILGTALAIALPALEGWE